MIMKDKIRGSLIGGAAGDALGYPVEFLTREQILSRYGHTGIGQFDLAADGTALISDDTQMTLFTASALLFGMHRQNERGISGNPRAYALPAYFGWLHTQNFPYSTENRIPEDITSWASHFLQDVPRLYARRAPGMTCLRALELRREQYDRKEHIENFISDPINNSKGCGGVMRVAPLGLAVHFWDMDRLDMEGAQLAAITHSHSLGYMPAALLTHILNRLVYGEKADDLKAIVLDATAHTEKLFAADAHIAELSRLIMTAVALSENGRSDAENIRKLGEGWVAEEALAISLYCSLKYKEDFSGAIIAAVNHSGDSDSTGAITGNISGAFLGYDRIEQKWKANLELHDLILELADRLSDGFR